MDDFLLGLGYHSKRLFGMSGHDICATEISYMNVKRVPGAAL